MSSSSSPHIHDQSPSHFTFPDACILYTPFICRDTQSTVSIPIFTGANWSQPEWWPTMIAYIEASECGWVLDFPAPTLDPKADKEDCDFYIAWTKVNLIIVGSIKLCFLDPLKNKFLTHATTSSLIAALKAEYSTLGSLVLLCYLRSSWIQKSPSSCRILSMSL